jgi:hypothetical protein
MEKEIMTNEIEQLIKKHLPAQVGDTLKKVLEQGERDAKTIIEQKEEISKLTTRLETANNKLSHYRNFDDRNAKLEVRERDCDKRERDLKIATLEYKLEVEKDKTAFTKNVALGLVRNTNYRTRILSDSQIPTRDEFNNVHYDNKYKEINEEHTTE